MLELQRWLTPAEALSWMNERQDFKEPPGTLDADPFVVASGYNSSGAGLYTPRRGGSFAFDEVRGGVIVDGSMVCDGLIVNRGVVFVRGNLLCRGLLNDGYLIVAGDLVCERFLGENEPGGTIVMGSAEAAAVTLHVHQLGIWGAQLLDWVDDESQGQKAAQARLREWGLLLEGEEPYPWKEIGERFRRWAEAAAPLPEEWVARPFTPRLPAPPPPPRVVPALPPLVHELEQWLEAEGPTQREKLDELGASWMIRLLARPGDEKQLARRLIAKHITSKKLIAARDEMLAELAKSQ